MIKKLVFLLVVLGTAYAPIELTRVIVATTQLEPQYIFEIAFMWVWYVAAMILVWRLVCR